MAIYNGGDFLVGVKIADGTTKYLGYATSCSLSMQQDSQEITVGSYKRPTAEAKPKEFRPTFQSFTISSDHVMSDAKDSAFEDLQNALLNGTELILSFSVCQATSGVVAQGQTGSATIKTTNGNPVFKITGKGYCTSFSITGETDSMVTISMQFQGSTDLEFQRA